MKILLDVTVGPDSRLTGSVGIPARANQHAFSGAMELIAHIEYLCRQCADFGRTVKSGNDRQPPPSHRTTGPNTPAGR